MGVTKVNRKQLAELLKHNNTSKVRTAISRGSLIENKNGHIDLHADKNRKWLENQIKLARNKGLVIDIDLGAEQPNMELDHEREQTPDKGSSSNSIDLQYKRARTELVKEQTITAKLNREIALGNYLRTSDMVEALKVYLDQTMNIANTNISNVATRFCKAHDITSAELIVKLKSELTEALNLAMDEGRKEVMNCVERMVAEQVEKLAKK